jgi:polysaccharide export outer membrane protein
MLNSNDSLLAKAYFCIALIGTLAVLSSPALVHSQQSSAMVAADLNAKLGAGNRAPDLNPTGVREVPEGFEKLKLSPGYLLEMNIYNIPEMTSQLRIDAKGFATVPLVGAVHLDGDTVPEAQNAIAALLVEKEILKDPQVSLNILEFSSRYISVLGEVQSPGRVELLAPTSLQNALASAGGETVQAGSNIEIQHPTSGGELSSRVVEYTPGKDTTALQNTLVEPGDTVMVHRAGVIYVLGAVNRPGGYLMVNGGALSVIEAVSLAGGTTLQASTSRAVVVRRQGTGIIQFKVPLGQMEVGKSAPSQLQIGDALYVPFSTWKSVLINGSNVLSAATSAAIFRAP